MNEFLMTVGYVLFAFFGVGLALMTAVMWCFGGGDCGPLLGNWRQKGSLRFFLCLIALTLTYWYGLYHFWPFDISIAINN